MVIQMSLPRKTFARKMINLQGWTAEEEVIEVASIDNVSHEEAARRVAEARRQKINRAVGQRMRHIKVTQKFEDARRKALSIAYHEGRFLCSKDLFWIALTAGWPTGDTGKPMREILMPLERAGMLAELRDEDDRFIGYSITDAGRKELLG